MSSHAPLPVRAYRWLLRLLPSRLRDRHGSEMASTFASLYREARRRSGRLAGLRVCLRELGGFLRILRQERGPVGGPHRWLDDLRADVLYSLRQLRRTPVGSVVIVATLAVGIGANSALFSVADALLIRPLPLPEAERLVSVSSLHGEDRFAAAGRDLAEWSGADSFAVAGGAWRGGRALVLDGRSRRIDVAAVTPDYLRALGIEPRIGRGFLDEDVGGEAAPVAILGHRPWTEAFASDADIVGRKIELDGRRHTVVGVMPSGFDQPDGTDLWVPLSLDEVLAERASSRDFTFVGRLRGGVGLEEARDEVRAIAVRLAREHPDSHAGWDALLLPLRRVLLQDQDGRITTTVRLLSGAVAFLLLITCANVASLLLARLTRRRSELSLRAALGAGRGRLVRQLCTESLVISLLGGACGLLVAAWSLPVLVREAPLPGQALGGALIDVRVDLRVVVATAGIVLATGLVLGLVAALRSSRQDAAPLLRDGSRGSVPRPGNTASWTRCWWPRWPWR